MFKNITVNRVINFNGIYLDIEPIDSENFYVNITGVSKQHGKNITHWKTSKGTKEYIEELEKSNGSDWFKKKIYSRNL